MSSKKGERIHCWSRDPCPSICKISDRFATVVMASALKPPSDYKGTLSEGERSLFTSKSCQVTVWELGPCGMLCTPNCDDCSAVFAFSTLCRPPSTPSFSNVTEFLIAKCQPCRGGEGRGKYGGCSSSPPSED